jgi:hypothetical protein
VCRDNFEKAQKVKDLLHALPLEERLKILQSELSDCGLTVVFGGSSRTSAQLCVNIYNSKELEIDKILHTLADFLRDNKSAN